VTTTIVETGIARKITVVKHSRHTANLAVRDTDLQDAVYAHLTKEESEKIGLALLGENATVITNLPKAERKYAWVQAGGIDRPHDTDPAEVLDHAKKLLAIHKFLVEKKAKDEEETATKAKAEEEAAAKRDKRRNELVTDLRGFGDYTGSSHIFQKAIDRIIELEAAQA